MDSGCSRHMTGDSTLLTEFKERAGPSITFGDDNKGYTVGYGLISKDNVRGCLSGWSQTQSVEYQPAL